MTSAYFFLPATYDFQQATLVQGALDAGLQVAGSVTSNYCTVTSPVGCWEALQGYDFVFFCERTIADVVGLRGKITHTNIVFVDGSDSQEIVLPPTSIGAHCFKRELPLEMAKKCQNIQGVGFGIEGRYIQEFKPFKQREFLLSCMLRLDTNAFRRVLQSAVTALQGRLGSKIFNGSTGEISYTGTSSVPQATPKYSHVLANSCLSVSCLGVGQDTGRFWEILGAGCLLFSQRLSIAIPNLPEDGKHCIYFDGEKDFLDRATYYLTHLDEAENIARNGYEYALASAKSEARFDYILRSINNNKPYIATWLERLHVTSHNFRLRYKRLGSRLSEKFAR